MDGPGVELRMRILREAANQQLLKPLHTHGWEAAISSESDAGEYIIITATKSTATRKIALLYSSATDNKYYKALDRTIDHIFTNGDLYHIESYAYGIATPVTPIDEFFPLLVEWNKQFAPATHRPVRQQRTHSIRYLRAENPLESVWARLNQFASLQLAEKLVKRRAMDESVVLQPTAVHAKAEGVAYAIQNAADYFRSAPFESLNKRILSLYYGVLALAFAELLASPHGSADLDQVEGMTKHGHGLYTVSSDPGDFGELHVGLLATGFFPQWISFLGHDISQFPKAKARAVSDLDKRPPETFTTVCKLLAALPELGDLFLEVFDSPPSWLVPTWDKDANPRPSVDQLVESTYIQLHDPSGRISQDQILHSSWPITEITPLANKKDGQAFRVRVDHAGLRFWHEALPIHRSPFNAGATLILPVLGAISEYRALATIILYTLSIMVRYMPSAWRRVEGGDWDQHLALVKTALGVFERLLPEEFLESIIGERIHTSQPGSLF